jgi:branched-chain amino acid transport system permease protein
MHELLGGYGPALMGQLLVGLINGSFYALLSLGLAIIFGMLHVVNFAHGAQYMLGAFCAWGLLTFFGIGYWPALILSPLLVAATGIVMERVLIRHVYKLDHFYGLLLTLGISLVIEGLLRNRFGLTGQPYEMPASLAGVLDLGFMYLPIYRGWVVLVSVVICFVTWYAIERTRLGASLRAAEENPSLVQAFGIDVPRMVTLTYALGVGLAALAGVMAAPMYQVSPTMGSNLIIVVFAVVVIGGMGSLLGAIIGGFAIGIFEGLTKFFYPEASTTVVFVIMALLLLLKPTGLFGGDVNVQQHGSGVPVSSRTPGGTIGIVALLAIGLLAPFLVYPIFAMKVLCYALFACAFALLAGFGGLISFGHAAFFGSACYVTAYLAARWGMPPEVTLVAGTAVASLLGLAFGWLAIRKQGIYFAMITLALSQLVFFVALQSPFTGGEDGLQGVPRGTFMGLLDLRNNLTMYYLVFGVFLLGFLTIYRAVHSPFGQVLRALRDNESRAVSLGYDAGRVKLLAFVLSAGLSGLAGSLKTLVVQIATLADVHWALSGDVLLMGLIGGLGNVIGPVIGSVALLSMQTRLAGFGAWVTVIQGIIFIASVLVFRRGIVGALDGLLSRLARKPNIAAENTPTDIEEVRTYG